MQVLRKELSTAPNGQGVLVIDEHGDRKRGHKTAHIGKQYLANLGKLDTGVVSVTSLPCVPSIRNDQEAIAAMISHKQEMSIFRVSYSVCQGLQPIEGTPGIRVTVKGIPKVGGYHHLARLSIQLDLDIYLNTSQFTVLCADGGAETLHS